VNDNEAPPNPALREHVTNHSFVLALRKTHIVMLVAVAHNERRRDILRDSISPAHGLKARGLMLHCTDVFGRSGPGVPQKTFATTKVGSTESAPWNDYYRLTKAGWAVFDLLVEAGLAQPIKAVKRKYA
jgi:hypothetical protein